MRASAEGPDVRPGLFVMLRALTAGAMVGALLGLVLLGAAPLSEMVRSLATGETLSATLAASADTMDALLYGVMFAGGFGAVVGAATAVLAAGVWLFTVQRSAAHWPARLAAAVAAFVLLLGLAAVLGVGLEEPVSYVIGLVGGLLAYWCAPRVGYERVDRIRADTPVAR